MGDELTPSEACRRAATEVLFDGNEGKGAEIIHNLVAAPLETEIERIGKQVELEEAFGELFCAMKGYSPIDPMDGSPNWWATWKDAKKALGGLIKNALNMSHELAEAHARIKELESQIAD